MQIRKLRCPLKSHQIYFCVWVQSSFVMSNGQSAGVRFSHKHKINSLSGLFPPCFCGASFAFQMFQFSVGNNNWNTSQTSWTHARNRAPSRWLPKSQRIRI